MDEIVTDLSTRGLELAAEANIHGMLEAFRGIPGAVYEASDAFARLRLPGVPSPVFNAVARTRLAPGQVEEAVNRMIAHQAEHHVPYWYWWVGPTTEPRDLGATLLAKGLLPHAVDAPTMGIDLARLPEPPKVPGLAVLRVTDQEGEEAWARAFNAAFGHPEYEGLSWAEAARRLESPVTPWVMYVGWYYGKPAGIAMLVPTGGLAGLMTLAVVGEARGKGIGTALTVRAMQDGRELGFRAGVLIASEMTAGLYERIGFRRVGAISRYLWRGR
ncbi:MAG: GNAT family N-acetyltransferase [SAR202 cluster bacterium]|nr:GNAT family N-acetyltransferase [SAR202 cluster bacterium]